MGAEHHDGADSESAPVGGSGAPLDDVAAPVEDEPDAVAAVFGDGVVGARRYVALLAGDGLLRGLIGPRERGRLWTRHVLNCALAAAAVPRDARVVDIGSGAGLPGIPLALARPDLHIDLVETLLRRTVFLDEAVADLGLDDRVRVVRARAEDAVDRVGGADVVTARAVAPLAKLARWAAPLLRADGLFLALKGESAAAEVERDAAAARAAGIVDLRVEVISGDGPAEAAVTLVIGRRVSDAPRDGGRRARESAGGGPRRKAGKGQGGPR